MHEKSGTFALEREDFDDITVLRIKAPMLRDDEETDALFHQTYSTVEDAGRVKVVVNVDSVVFLSSMGIGRLVTLMHKVRTAGGRLVLCKLARPIEELLQKMHLTEILLVYPDEREAIQSFARS